MVTRANQRMGSTSRLLRAIPGGTWLRWLVTIGLVSWLVVSVEWPEVGRLFWHLQLIWVAPAVALRVGARFVTTGKWNWLLRGKGVVYPYLYLLRMVWISSFFGNFLPSGVGADSVRMLAVARGSGRAPEIASTIFMERLTGMVSLLSMALLGGVWCYQRFHAPQVVLALLIPVVLLLAGMALLWTAPGDRLCRCLLAWSRRWPGHRFFEKVHAAIRAYRHEPRAVGVALAFSVVIQLIRVVSFYFLARALGIPLTLGEMLALVPPAMFITLLPISIGYLGVQEGAFTVLLGLAGVDMASAVSLALLSRLINLVESATAASVFLGYGLGKSGSLQAAAEPAG